MVLVVDEHGNDVAVASGGCRVRERCCEALRESVEPEMRKLLGPSCQVRSSVRESVTAMMPGVDGSSGLVTRQMARIAEEANKM